jgi:hypothetical protein
VCSPCNSDDEGDNEIAGGADDDEMFVIGKIVKAGGVPMLRDI